MTERQHISSCGPYELMMGYARAVRVDQQVWVSGTAPLWPDDRCDPDPEKQLRRCFEIIEKALMEAGGSLADVVRTRVYLVNPADFGLVTRVHGDLFAETRPANTTVVVGALLNPEWRVEVEVDAVLGVKVRHPLG